MLPKHHIIFGLIFSTILWLLFPSISLTSLAIIFISSVLIDVDHYLYYLFNEKDFSLSKAYFWFKEKREKWKNLAIKERQRYKRIQLIFHGIEFMVLLVILSFFNTFFFWILIGFLFHMFIDITELLIFKDTIWIKLSQIYVYFSNKRKKGIIL